MKKFNFVSAVAVGLAAAVLGLATPASAAPAGGDKAVEVIKQLEADGNRVIVNRQGSTPLSEATVVRVRPGPPIREWVWSNGGSRRNGDNRFNDRVLETVGRVMFVDIR